MYMTVYLSLAKLRLYHKEVFKLMCKDFNCGELLGYFFLLYFLLFSKCSELNLDILIKDK